MNVKTSRNTSGRNSGFLTVSCEWTDLEENNSLLRFWKCLHLASRISLWAYIAVSPCPTRNKTSAVSWSSIRCWKSRKSVSTPSQVLSLAWKESMFAFANREKRQARNLNQVSWVANRHAMRTNVTHIQHFRQSRKSELIQKHFLSEVYSGFFSFFLFYSSSLEKRGIIKVTGEMLIYRLLIAPGNVKSVLKVKLAF